MTQKDFYPQVQCDLEEGYSVKLIDNDGFKMKVSFAYLDNTGEPYYTCVGIEGSEFAHISEIMSTDELERFVVNGNFELYK
jgi:hypothetical protein